MKSKRIDAIDKLMSDKQLKEAKDKAKVMLTDFDPSEYIETPEDAVHFLQDALETENQAVIAGALSAVCKSMGMTLISQRTGLSREHLYRSFSENGNPTPKTILAVMSAIGV